MSGYSSKREAMEVLVHTIESEWNSDAPSAKTSDYYMGPLFDDTFYSRGPGYGWGMIYHDVDYAEVMLRHLRKGAARRIRAEEEARVAQMDKILHGNEPLPDGFRQRDVRDAHNRAIQRIRAVSRVADGTN